MTLPRINPGAFPGGAMQGKGQEAMNADVARLALTLFGIGTMAVGTKPATLSTKRWLVQGSTEEVALDGAGAGTITFPKAFPGGIVAVVASVVPPGSGPFSTTLTSFAVAGTPLTTIAVSWIALGW